MKKIIIGLGNPGKEYQNSRHNLGFMFVDYLQCVLSLEKFVEKKRFLAQISLNSDIILAKPQTFMNKSGEAVQKILSFFAESEHSRVSNNLVVVHDDLDLVLGQFKIQQGIGPRQHNGLLSIYQSLGFSDFWHVRLGIDDRQGDRTIPPEKYVLQPLSAAAMTSQQELFDQVYEQMKQLGLLGLVEVEYKT